jgi:hypothetical protein
MTFGSRTNIELTFCTRHSLPNLVTKYGRAAAKPVYTMYRYGMSACAFGPISSPYPDQYLPWLFPKTSFQLTVLCTSYSMCAYVCVRVYVTVCLHHIQTNASFIPFSRIFISASLLYMPYHVHGACEFVCACLRVLIGFLALPYPDYQTLPKTLISAGCILILSLCSNVNFTSIHRTAITVPGSLLTLGRTWSLFSRCRGGGFFGSQEIWAWRWPITSVWYRGLYYVADTRLHDILHRQRGHFACI